MDYIQDTFSKIFRTAPRTLCFAPGRVNLIGEHTDYNGGYVFPCAIDMGIYCSAARRTDGKLRFYSENYSDDGVVEYSLTQLSLKHSWADYPVSVILALRAFGYTLDTGCDFCFSGDLPEGAGLSSSAAIETAVCTAIKDMYSLPLTPQETALICQFAENRFIGVNCGIMDQFASAVCRKGSALLLNSATLEYSFAPIGDAVIVIVNSGVKHSLAASAYNDRRRECETACSALGVHKLCSLTPAEFEERKHLITDSVILKRAKHVIYENRRVLDAVEALSQGDTVSLGRLMNESHASLRDDYEVSCAELDILSGTARSVNGVYGARMTGGGFGGCTVNLMKQGAENDFTEAVRAVFTKLFGRTPEIFRVVPSEGANVIG